jgi:hypothetical protein
MIVLVVDCSYVIVDLGFKDILITDRHPCCIRERNLVRTADCLNSTNKVEAFTYSPPLTGVSIYISTQNLGSCTLAVVTCSTTWMEL